jgi:hypothetical protein
MLYNRRDARFGSIAPSDTFAWTRGETTTTADRLMAFNGITANAMSKRALELVG